MNKKNQVLCGRLQLFLHLLLRVLVFPHIMVVQILKNAYRPHIVSRKAILIPGIANGQQLPNELANMGITAYLQVTKLALVKHILELLIIVQMQNSFYI